MSLINQGFSSLFHPSLILCLYRSMFITKPCRKIKQHVSQCIPCIDNFLQPYVLHWWSGRERGHLSTEGGRRSVGRRMVIPCKMEKTGGSVGLDSRHSRGQWRKEVHGLLTGDWRSMRQLGLVAVVGVDGWGDRWLELGWPESGEKADEAGWSRGRGQVESEERSKTGGGGQAAQAASVEEAGGPNQLSDMSGRMLIVVIS
jgi:hypothetical protein